MKHYCVATAILFGLLAYVTPVAAQPLAQSEYSQPLEEHNQSLIEEEKADNYIAVILLAPLGVLLFALFYAIWKTVQGTKKMDLALSQN